MIRAAHHYNHNSQKNSVQNIETIPVVEHTSFHHYTPSIHYCTALCVQKTMQAFTIALCVHVCTQKCAGIVAAVCRPKRASIHQSTVCSQKHTSVCHMNSTVCTPKRTPSGCLSACLTQTDPWTLEPLSLSMETPSS